MTIDKLWRLRLKKWWKTKMFRRLWTDLPFEIARTDISPDGKYTDYPAPPLAEFDCAGKHWIVVAPSQTNKEK